MSAFKSELKMAIAHELGCGFDDVREAAVADMHRHEGAVSALRSVARLIMGLKVHVTSDMDEGKLPTSFDSELQVADLLKRWIDKAEGAAVAYAERIEVQRIQAQGKIQGVEAAVKAVKKMHDSEQTKAGALRKAESEAVVQQSVARNRPTGAHPGQSVAAQRKAEESEAKPKKAAKKRRKRAVKADGTDA